MHMLFFQLIISFSPFFSDLVMWGNVLSHLPNFLFYPMYHPFIDHLEQMQNEEVTDVSAGTRIEGTEET